jgi:hypothetical protein
MLPLGDQVQIHLLPFPQTIEIIKLVVQRLIYLFFQTKFFFQRSAGRCRREAALAERIVCLEPGPHVPQTIFYGPSTF